MIINSRIFAGIAKLLIGLVAATGVALSLGIADGAFNPGSLFFFTILASLLAAVYYIVDGIWMLTGHEQEWAPQLKHIALLAVLLTGIIANTLLVGVNVAEKASDAISATLLHQITPIVAFLDFVLLERHGSIKPTHPLVWCVFPLAYLAFVMIAVGCFGVNANIMDATTNYPYPFFDINLSGVGTVATSVGGIFGAYLVLGYAIFGIDKLIARLHKEN